MLPAGSPLSDTAWRRRQRWMTAVLLVHLVPMVILLLVTDDDVAHTVVEILPIGAAAAISAWPAVARRWRTAATTFGLVTCSALLIHATDGLIESHFHFFAIIALVTLYQEWMPFLLAFIFVVVHHGVVGLVLPTQVYNHQAAWNRPLLWAFIHGGYVALASAANLVAWRLSENERERTEQILNATGEAIYGIDREGRITFANPALARLSGWSLAEVEGRDHHEVLGHADADGRPHGREGCSVCADVMLADGGRRSDELFTRRDGGCFPVEFTSHPVDTGGRGDGVTTVVNFRDITERREFERKLNRLALHDPLTGLPNRTLLLDRIGMALSELRHGSHMVGVIFCDLDRFKRINDSLGHAAGDRLLRLIAARLRASARPDDTIARLGGDEFVICCNGIGNEETAVRIAERVRALFEEPFDLGEATLHVQCSVGAAATDDPDTSSAELIRRADQAMYVAKHAGDGIRVYEPAMAEHVNVQMFMEEDLRRALTGDQFEVHYQPTVDIPTGRVTGVEALLRWEHPDRGLVSPDTFIPLAEDTGLIVPIGAWVLGEACRKVTMWNVGRDLPLTVGVNVSGRQLQQADFADAVIRTLDATGCRPEWLLLEITETALIATLETASPGLRRLRDLGIHIGLDDFGTGYSSLTYLRHLPVDVLKIDRSFVTEVGSRPDQRTLVSAVVEMARALSMHTVAEGVELEEERAALRAIGCESAQGYLYTRPLPAAEIDRLLAAGPPPLEPQLAEATTPAGEEATEPADRQATV